MTSQEEVANAFQLVLSREAAASAGGNKFPANTPECQSLLTLPIENQRVSGMPLISAPISAGQPQRPGCWPHPTYAELNGRCTSECQVVTQKSGGAFGCSFNGYEETCLKANSPVPWSAPAAITKYRRWGGFSNRPLFLTALQAGSRRSRCQQGRFNSETSSFGL